MHGPNFNTTIHLAMHQIVANQLWDDNHRTHGEQRASLLRIGYDCHKVLHSPLVALVAVCVNARIAARSGGDWAHAPAQ